MAEAGGPQVAIILLESQTMETSSIWYFFNVDAKIWINEILEKIGVLSRILLPTGLRVFCANFLGQKCARANFNVFRMSRKKLAEKGG